MASTGKPSQHPLVTTEQVSSFSALLPALQEHRVRGSFVEDTFRVPRSSKGLMLKPLNPWRGQTKIKFDSLNHVYRGRGVPLSILSSGMAPGNAMCDCTEQVLSGCPSGILTLRVTWPGYTDVDCVAKLEMRMPATRLDVARAVYEQYNRLLDRALTSPPANRHGCWFVGKGGISIHNLVLLSISNDVDDVYEAELDVVLGRYDPVAMLAAAMRRQ